MPALLKRVSEPTAERVAEIARREGRTFVAQLDRIVDAGLAAMGESTEPTAEPQTADA